MGVSFLLLEKETPGKQEGKASVNPRGVWISESHRYELICMCTHVHTWVKRHGLLYIHRPSRSVHWEPWHLVPTSRFWYLNIILLEKEPGLLTETSDSRTVTGNVRDEPRASLSPETREVLTKLKGWAPNQKGLRNLRKSPMAKAGTTWTTEKNNVVWIIIHRIK